MIKIVAVALIFAVIIVYLRSINSELYTITLVGAGIILLSIAFEYISNSVTFISELINLTGIDKGLFAIIFKITAIAYIVEFGAETINDLGLKSLAEKLIFIGKIVIFSLSIPIFYAIYNLLVGILK